MARVSLINLQKKLEEELERLKNLLKMGLELRLVWLPNNDSEFSGEVKGETIFIYEQDFDKALETLKHEFLDYAISQVIEPYRQLVNSLIFILNKEAYRKKEELIERLREII